MGGSAVDTPTSRALAGAFVVTPLLSQTANGHRAGSTHPTRANPRRRQEFYESARPVSYGNATGDQPVTAIPLTPYKSDFHMATSGDFLMATDSRRIRRHQVGHSNPTEAVR
jgi:hypothetical protein